MTKYKLNETLSNPMFFTALKQAERRHTWNYFIRTELEELSACEMEHDDVDLIETWQEVSMTQDLLKIVGFIVLENIKIESITISTKTNTLELIPEFAIYDGDLESLHSIMMQLGLNPEHWIKGKAIEVGNRVKTKLWEGKVISIQKRGEKPPLFFVECEKGNCGMSGTHTAIELCLELISDEEKDK